MKISFLAQRVDVSEILRHFPQIYHTHSRSVNDLTKIILSFSYRKVPHMLPANISQIGLVVLEKKSFEWFLPHMGMAAILNFGS